MQKFLHTLLELYAVYALTTKAWLALIPVLMLTDSPAEGQEGFLDIVGQFLLLIFGLSVLFGSIGLIWGFVKKIRDQTVARRRFFNVCIISAMVAAVGGVVTLCFILYAEINNPQDTFMQDTGIGFFVMFVQTLVVAYVAVYYFKYFNRGLPS